MTVQANDRTAPGLLLVTRLVTVTGVPSATLAGTSFGEFGEGYLRLSYANSRDNLREALQRIEAAVKALGVSV